MSLFPANGQHAISDFLSRLDRIDFTADAAIDIHRSSDLNIQTVGADRVIKSRCTTSVKNRKILRLLADLASNRYVCPPFFIHSAV